MKRLIVLSELGCRHEKHLHCLSPIYNYPPVKDSHSCVDQANKAVQLKKNKKKQLSSVQCPAKHILIHPQKNKSHLGKTKKRHHKPRLKHRKL